MSDITKQEFIFHFICIYMMYTYCKLICDSDLQDSIGIISPRSIFCCSFSKYAYNVFVHSPTALICNHM